jgi:nucleotide-binding universal stress UspA family protein
MTRARILVPVNRASGVDPAFERGLALARASDAELHLIHAVPADRPFSSYAAERLQRWAELRKRAADAKVTVQTIEQHGDPAGIIAVYADDREVDLIVMASEGRTGWRRFRQPSVAERVMRRTTRPVLVVREDDVLSAPGPSVEPAPLSLKRIMVAVDFNVASAVALRTAAGLASRYGASLTMVHAMRWPRRMVFSGGEAARLVSELPAQVSALQKRLTRQARAFGAGAGAGGAEAVVVTGVPHRRIVETAASVDADLIVMGAPPRTALDEAAFGSTVRAVLRRATMPVLVVPVAAGGQSLAA